MDSSGLKKRQFIIMGAMLLIVLIYVVRLFYLQIIDKSYEKSAARNAIRYLTDHPARGLIYDRRDSLLVYNEASYDLMVVPKEMRAFDTADLCSTLDISTEDLLKQINKAFNYSAMLPSLIYAQISKEDYGYLQERLFKFPGFYIQNRTLRKYPHPVAAHILGYVGEVDNDMLEKDPYYKMGDYTGLSGIEKAYEKELRGIKGQRVVLVDVHNREQGSYDNGSQDRVAWAGQSLWSTLDLELQRYSEGLMKNKRGSIVAIEPATGEILCIVSSPGYDPNLLVGSGRSKAFVELMHDTVQLPLFNRALIAIYPPGSTFKLANGLIAEQEKILTASTVYNCPGGYRVGDHIIKCHHAGAPNLVAAVQSSCNTYFCRTFYNIVSNRKYGSTQEGYQVWKNYINQMGFGVRFGTDLPYESAGIIPSVDFFNKKYKGRWNGNTIVSMGIGQGEVATTPLQMANLMAIIANRGFYIKPHIIKAIGKKEHANTRYDEVMDSRIDKQYFDPIIQGMVMAVQAGTARRAQIKGISVAGKTGTAQNPHGKDHSVFSGFAPVSNPQIVVFVLVENGSWGGTVAAPIASLVMEYYLNRKIERKDLEESMTLLKLY
ncbi:MAG: penicillin-binding protein 2 [Bacteroidales bacterium]|jgi:penicillin-binding protein 2|nr:penicillin-binding protein 2 [Bacteroidales bacterium]